MRFRPVVKAARVIVPTASLACSGSRVITFRISRDPAVQLAASARGLRRRQ